MKITQTIWACVLLLTDCAWGQVRTTLPYDAWSIGVLAPSYMEAWIETIDVEDTRGRVFVRAGGGTASVGYAGNPAGWPSNPAAASRRVVGADLPEKINVRWQSLVEPKTYRTTLVVPAKARELMLTRAESRVVPGKSDYRNLLLIGVAPGGVVKAWVRSPGSQPIEVLCQQAEVELNGPYRGLSDGRHRPVSERTASFLENHSVLYDSWKCTGSQD